MWYLQFQLVCDKLFSSIWIEPPFAFVCGSRYPLLIIAKGGSFSTVSTLRLFSFTSIACGFLYERKNAKSYDLTFKIQCTSRHSNPGPTDQERKPPVRLNFWKFRVIVILHQNNVIFHPVISAPFVGICSEKHPLHVLKPCKIRAETVHLLSDKW